MALFPADSLILRQQNSLLSNLLEQGLMAAGMRVVQVSTAYDVVVEAERASTPFRHVILGVDYFGREEFRLLPLIRREWPSTVVAAYHSPGFEHKGLLSELMGADVVLSGPDDVARFLETLAPSPKEPAAQAPPAPSRPHVPAPAPRVSAHTEALLAAAAPSFDADLDEALAQDAIARREPSRRSEPDLGTGPANGTAQVGGMRPREAAPTPAAGHDTEPAVELTEEELRLLLGQEDDS